jgi:predicted PurR-regulated permease PerM
MSFPPPTDKQARVLWNSLTALAVAILLGLIGLLFWGFALVVNRLSGVLLPLAVGGILAYLLDPVVDFLERRKVPRRRAIALVFLIALAMLLLLLGTVLPRLIFEVGELAEKIPDYASQVQGRLTEWLKKSPKGIKAQYFWATYGPSIQPWLAEKLPTISAWVLSQMGKFVSWAWLVLGFFLVPVYAFYFLLEKKGITQSWKDYLPLHQSRWKEELVFVLSSVNDSLIVFFRGQVLVALCVGALMAVGLSLVGLNYALLLGVAAGFLGIVPYLGVISTIIPSVILAVIQFGDWKHPLLVVLVFILVQTAEGWIISPRIIGGRVGLHPLTIIVAVMVGTTLLGGIAGAVLAIPLTAALRTLMFRYVWKEPTVEESETAPAAVFPQ